MHSLFAVGAKLDVSQIVNQAMAESILDSKVKVTAPRNSQGGDGYYSKCNYYSAPPGKTLLLRVYRAAEGYYAQYEFDVVTQNTPSLKTVPGLGDKAMVTGGKASALPASSMMLYVLKGNVLLTVGLSGFDDENASLSKARTVAEKILAQL
ncbi:MAG: hypothetical protein ABI925_08390 [Verrucomicrobiota bacterium]